MAKQLLHAVADTGTGNAVGTAIAGTFLSFGLDLVITMVSVGAALALVIPVAVFAVFRFIRRVLDITHVLFPPFRSQVIPPRHGQPC